MTCMGVEVEVDVDVEPSEGSEHGDIHLELDMDIEQDDFAAAAALKDSPFYQNAPITAIGKVFTISCMDFYCPVFG